MSVRTRRVAGELQKALGEIIGRDHADVTDGLLTVTAVDISPDLRNAKVFISILGGSVAPEKVLRLLTDRAPAIRPAVGRKVYLRTIPQLLFVLDESGERVERITKLINEWHAEKPDEPKSGE